MEYWEKISGYNTNYEISNHGNIRNIRSGKNLSGSIDSHGYKYVFLTKIKKHKFHNIHRLVAIAFISNPEGKPQVNHINRIKIDNRVENLEWVTAKENIIHGYKNGLLIQNSKPISQYDLSMNKINSFKGALDAANITGIQRRNIRLVCQNKRKTAGGYIWQFD